MKYIEDGLSPSGPLAGSGHFLALKWSAPAQGVTSLKVGLIPSHGTGYVEAIDDNDHNGVFKIAEDTKSIRFIQSDGTHKNAQTFELKLTLEADELGA